MTAAAETGEPGRLAFTVVDEVVHHLDTPVEPWSIEVEVAVEGRLDDDRLRRAVGEALLRHPMTRARCLPGVSGDPCRLAAEPLAYQGAGHKHGGGGQRRARDPADQAFQVGLAVSEETA